MAQAVHAGIDFSLRFPGLVEAWHRDSNNVVIVGAPNEAGLLMLDSLAYSLGMKHQLVTEPDIGDAATAIVLEPGSLAKRMCAEFPLALREDAVA